MWKYVTRRIKDTVEKTYNVLDVRRTWTCGEKVPQNSTTDDPFLHEEQTKQKSLCWIDKTNWTGANSNSSSSNDEEFKEKIRRKHCLFDNSFLGAITWSSAIICGWYTSQLLCLHRRNIGWDSSSCHYSKVLLNPSRAFHTNLLTHRALAAPVTPIAHRRFNSTDAKRETNEIEIQQAVFNVSNDGLEVQQPKAEKVNSAARELLSVLSNIEFELGVKNIKAGQYDIAVSHLKLATSHHHAGATFNLGVCYEQGLGVKKDLKLAVDCYQEASSLGHAKSMYNLGVFYARGLGGLEKNRNAARACFNAAAKLGQNEAIVALNGSQQNTNSLLESAIKLQYVAVT